MKQYAIARAVRHALFPLMALSAVFAQPAVAAAAAEEDVTEVTVTGSRIRQETGMTTPVPVTSLSLDELKTLNPGATLTDQVAKLPQLFQTESAQRSSGALFGNAGGSYINLRGLGNQRTLVLLDGSRVVPNDRIGAVNIGTFPTALIKSVDIVTGGASAQYGADAVGGVVNFVLDRDFQGAKLNLSTGMNEFGDGQNTRVSLGWGSRIGERLNVIGSADYQRISQIQRDPQELGDWFQRWGFVTNPAWSAAAPAQRAGIPQRLTLPNVVSAWHSPTGVINQAGFSLNRYTFNDTGTAVRPFVLGSVASVSGAGSTQSMSGGPEFSAGNRAFTGGPYGAQVREMSTFLGAKYEISDRVFAFGQVHWGVSESNQPDQRGNPHLQDGWFATIYRENAFLPASVRQAMIDQNVTSFRMDKLGQWLGAQNWNDDEMPRNRHTMLNWSVGLEAELSESWTGRFSFQNGTADKYTAVYDELRVDRMFLALDAVVDPATGRAICNVQRFNPSPAQLAAAVAGRTSKFGGPLLSPVGLDDTIKNCVPLNAFGQGQVSQAARDYLVSDKIGRSKVSQDFAELLFTGKVVDNWAGSINAALGGTYRRQAFSQRAFSGGPVAGPLEVEALGPPLNAPAIGIRGIPPGFTGGSANLHQFSTVPPINGSYDVFEAFAEVDVPLWKSAGAQRLDLNVAGRRSEYSSSGGVTAYKFGLDFQAFQDLRLRGTYSRDVREATFSERFDQQGGGGSVFDPLYGNASVQITTVRGGNPDLLPEKADTTTLGAVYQPSWLDGLQLSVDWYDVQINDAVGQLGIQRIVTDCVAGATQLCSLVERDPATNFIGRIFDVFLNVAESKVEGMDFEVQYTAQPDFLASQPERVAVRGFFSHLIERSNVSVPGAPVTQLGGGFTDGVLYPDWRANVSLLYGFGAIDVQLVQEWIASSKINTIWKEGVDIDDNTLPNYMNTNLRIGYSGETGGGTNYDISLFVTNLFDRHPIVIPSYNSRGGAQTVSNNYDAYGRSYQLGVNFRF